jgi:hypothetical protein
MSNKTPPYIGTGKTPPGNTNWKMNPTDERGICVEVDTSSAGFKTTPNYVASLAGNDDHWLLTGTSAIYDASPTHFSIFLCHLEKPLTPKYANDKNWHVTWIGAEVVQQR